MARQVITRAELNWPAMRNTQVPQAPTYSGMVIHWDGPGRNLTARVHGACVEYWKSVRQSHKARGWLDIGYSYGICPHGYEFEGRTFGYEQAAQPGGNRTYISVTLMTGGGERPTQAQIAAVRALRAALRTRGLRAEVKCHSDFVATDCPGDVARQMVRDNVFGDAMVSEKDKLYGAVMRNDRVKVPWGSEANSEWMMESVIVNIGQIVRDINMKLDAYIATTERYIAAVGVEKAAADMPGIKGKAEEQIALWEREVGK